MIKTISIHGYKSFHPTTPTVIEIDTAKQATFIYGLNGAGKSAIGEVIHGRSIHDAAFAHCKVDTTGTGPFRFLVYNENFVGRVIGETMQGIFTIGELDTAKQKEIDDKTAENLALEAELKTLDGKVESVQRLVDAEVVRGIEDIWKAHGIGKATKLSSLLEGYGKNKKGFFNDLRGFAVETGAALDSIERLEQRWKDASSTDTAKSAPEFDLSALTAIEADPIWAEPIEISAASRLAPLVASLGNADWVGQGRAYIQNDQCPFCQQGLPHDFEAELAELLEGNRKLKIDKISGLISTYALRLENLQTKMVDAFDDEIVEGTGLRAAWEKLEGQMKSNLVLMKIKKEKPGEAVEIAAGSYEALQAAAKDLKIKVEDFNQRILDRGSERAKIRKMFYQVLCADRSEAYAAHDAALGPLQTQLALELAGRAEVKGKIDENQLRLAELRSQQSGVDASVEAINAHLKELGVSSFWIRKRDGDGHLYCLARPNDDNCSGRSLSEGEKTLISFLYFVELIRGSHEETGTFDIAKTIAIIDDPISSLSQNYVYDIATIIGRMIKVPAGSQKLRQVIVLTHNLFFFHELVYQVAGRGNALTKCQMIRIQKNQYSWLAPLDPLALMNDYDALWHVLQDARDGKAPVQVVPNAMRSILEQFFTFTAGSDDFDEALKKLGDKDASSKFKALSRYLDRGSHKDGVNGPPIDWAQYDTNYYLGKLRALFENAGNEHHYLRKMGEEAAPPAQA